MSAPIRPTGPDYLVTPMRRAARMDHGFYDWRDTHGAAHLEFGGGVKLGIWVQLAAEWFPMDTTGQPFLPLGAPHRPWPDSQVYTQRDYGLRIGIYRLLDALAARGLEASLFLNARVASRYPELMRHVLASGHDIVAAGLDMGAIHHEGLSEADERAMIAEALEILAGYGIAPSAWHSPGWSQSSRTPALLSQAGITAMADWCNDEVPYDFATGQGSIVALPNLIELTDKEMIGRSKARLHEYEAAILRAARRLLAEAEQSGSGRILPLHVTSWLMGQPYRIAGFERLLDALAAMPGAGFVTVPQIRAATTTLA
ncbi:polysaccharide deacetylase family protein [Mangrovicoccus algicola]|uniref:Chitooligosaccharide deacetylase n=1 Tax=Mangrovicoccus algicola TaxID=2771008 RepID=A0A8J7D012_9RHOB|nr:polysaccharide deacetylase family protein [Mangrovicoccus algicola]MBE3638773.1 polysaccharide deacetylase family protein [Mangrovicoccus algicola]